MTPTGRVLSKSPGPHTKIYMKRRSVLWLVILVASSSVWVGFQVARDDDFYSMRKNFELFGEVYEQVVGSYVVRVDPERFMRTGMDAMLGTLDPWTDFLDEADNVAMDLRSQSDLGNVLLNLGRRAGRITLLSPDVNTGAYGEGLQVGDVLLEVAGQAADSLSLAQIHQLLLGEPGTLVVLGVLRQGSREIEVSLVRERPRVQYVSFAERLPDSDVALIRLDVFGPGAAHEIDSALEDLREERPLTGLILDLRDNPGGLVNEAVNLVGLFVPEDTPVVSTRGRSPESNLLYTTNDSPDWPDLRLALLVNRSSASASEIVAGALQDLDRALIVGEPSFGKGLVQVVRSLSYHTAIKLTLSRYFTPSGRGIRKDVGEPGAEPGANFRTTNGRSVREGYGIEPDVLISVGDETELEAALVRDASFFHFAGELTRDQGDAMLAATRASGRLALTDAVVRNFQAWLSESGFSYESELDRRINAIDEVIGDRSATEWLVGLRDASEDQKRAQFEASRARIRARLELEVASRLFSPAERVRFLLHTDALVIETLGVMDSGRDRGLLGHD